MSGAAAKQESPQRRDVVALSEIQVLFSKKTIREKPGVRLTFDGQWIRITQGGVTRMLSPVGVLITPKE